MTVVQQAVGAWMPSIDTEGRYVPFSRHEDRGDDRYAPSVEPDRFLQRSTTDEKAYRSLDPGLPHDRLRGRRRMRPASRPAVSVQVDRLAFPVRLSDNQVYTVVGYLYTPQVKPCLTQEVICKQERRITPDPTPSSQTRSRTRP